jgi:predicted hotdog family 3-hydroxylacyl-ACP dehydratase
MPAPEGAGSYEVTASGPGAEGGWTMVLGIPAGTSLCEGHFPGHAIVPGVTQLALVERALGDWQGTSGLSGIFSLRLRQPVLPGDELDVWVREGDGEALAFEVRRGGVVVANGSVRAADGGDLRDAPLLLQSQPPPPRGEGRGDAGFPPVEELVPHRGSMLLVRAVLAAGAESLTARAAVSPANPLVAAGLAPSWLALEAAAQAAALHEALGRSAEPGTPSAPRIGYLVSVRDAELGASFAAGAPMLVTVREAGGAGGLATYEVEAVLEADGRLAARGRLATYTLPRP